MLNSNLEFPKLYARDRSFKRRYVLLSPVREDLITYCVKRKVFEVVELYHLTERHQVGNVSIKWSQEDAAFFSIKNSIDVPQGEVILFKIPPHENAC